MSRRLISGVIAGGAQSAPDVTPDPMNWTDISYDDGVGNYDVTSRQMTGTTEDVELAVFYSTAGHDGRLAYKVTDAPVASPISVGFPTSAPSNFIPIANGGTFVVPPNKYVNFCAYPINTNDPVSIQVTVQNVSDENPSLDTFRFSGIA